MLDVYQPQRSETTFGKFRRFRWRGLGAMIVIASAAMLSAPLLGTAQKADAYAPQASYYYMPGGVTASGEVLDYGDWTAAHRTLAFGTKITVCYRGQCAAGVTITDRGPAAWTGRDLDLNLIVAEKIGLVAAGHGPVSYWTTGYDPAYLRHIS